MEVVVEKDAEQGAQDKVKGKKRKWQISRRNDEGQRGKKGRAKGIQRNRLGQKITVD